MKKFETEKLSDLADVFYSVMGGYPDDIREIEAYLKDSPLKELMFASDIERILKFDGFFADEIIDAVYALLPVKIRLNENKSVVLTPQAFRRLNNAKILMPASRSIDIDFPKAFNVFYRQFPQKIKSLISIMQSSKQEEKEEEDNPALQDARKPQTGKRTYTWQNTSKRSYRSEKREKQARDEQGLPKVVQRQLEKIEAAKEQKLQMQKQAMEQAQKEEWRLLKRIQRAQKLAELKRMKEEQRQAKREEKERCRAEKAEAKRQREEQKQKKKIRQQKAHQRKINEEIKQIQENRAERERQKNETQETVWQEIARLEQKTKDLEERKNKSLSELSLEEREKEKQRRHMAEYRENHERTKNQRKTIKELTVEEQEKRREENRRRNAVYRERHREELRQYHNARRAKLKAENPELLKEMDRKNNAKPARKKAGRTYYLLNKEKQDNSVRNNPNRPAINRKYKMKKRLRTTGPMISSLLQGILNSKSR